MAIKKIDWESVDKTCVLRPDSKN